MVELSKSKRVIFSKKGEQRKFILVAKNKLGLTWIQFSGILGISTRNLTDWKNEKISMSLEAVKIICRKLKLDFPKNTEIKDSFWYVNKGASLGGRRTYEKYGCIGGNEDIRMKKWHEWWEREGKFNNSIIGVKYPIRKPRKSKSLAEFIGIMLGDGGISEKQISITLHFLDDKEYIDFVVELIKKLFAVTPSVYFRKEYSTNSIVVSRVELVEFCTEKLGLKIGNKVKQQVDIPEWINENKNFKIACLRGLVDTDGSVFDHRYKVGGKMYCYKKLVFTSLSAPLLKSTYEIMNDIGIKSRMARGKEVWIDDQRDMLKYFKIVGSNNSKHLKRFES